jgi:glycosyltransferase involved in cell wall biosynthesis
VSGPANARVAHLSTVHPRNDARILLKMVRTLAQQRSWEVMLVVADGKGPGTDANGIAIHDVGKPGGGRLGRATLAPWRAFRELRRLHVDLVHFHDPELIPLGMLLKVLGHRVVYDVHEDVPRQILSKHWIHPLVRRPAAWAMSFLEWAAGLLFDAFVPATPKIAERGPVRKTVMVQNFPILAELVLAHPRPYSQRETAFVYVGGIGESRGAKEMIRAMAHLDAAQPVTLDLAGDIQPASLQAELRSLPGWNAVKYHGILGRTEVAELLGGARAGLVVLHPIVNYREAYPVKMFEYMAAGLPVVASDFPLWRHIVDSAGCGVLVDPLDPAAIATAMRWILQHPEDAEEMGKRGRRAVESIYNWESESLKLLALYDDLLGRALPAPS